MLSRKPALLKNSPLNRSRLVVGSGRSLPEVLAAVADGLLDERSGGKRHRAVTVMYFIWAPTQEMAAERLELPFSTYRRHLVSGVERMIDLLWQQELRGTGLSTKADQKPS
ncbi:hypothetical protein [Streptomyces sp. 6N106]|uniref:hypothetical protein n=1 Tax=Streptomyces sp. 6N106 TaxID=3457418 RepID=UPI003FD26A4B